MLGRLFRFRKLERRHYVFTIFFSELSDFSLPYASETHVQEEIISFSDNQSVNRQQSLSNIAAPDDPALESSSMQKEGKYLPVFSTAVH